MQVRTRLPPGEAALDAGESRAAAGHGILLGRAPEAARVQAGVEGTSSVLRKL